MGAPESVRGEDRTHRRGLKRKMSAANDDIESLSLPEEVIEVVVVEDDVEGVEGVEDGNKAAEEATLLHLARQELARTGGKASMAKRTKEERSEMGRKGAAARWGPK